MILHLFDLANFRNTAIIDHRNGDVDRLYIKSSKNEPAQMRITINSSFSRFANILTNKDFGIRYTDGDHDMLFVFRKRTLTDKHQIQLEMLSYVYTLASSPLYNVGRTLRDYSLATFLSELDSEIVFTPLGTDRDINILTGAEDNLKLLTDSVNYSEFFDWVDAGLTTVGGQLRPNIVYGDFRYVVDYYNTSSDLRFKPIDIDNITTTDNIYSDKIQLENAEITDSKEDISLVFPYVNNGTGYSSSTSIRLTSTLASYIRPDFPVEPITSPITGETIYCVRNPFAKATNNMKVYEYEEASNTQDSSGTFDTTIEITEEVLYKRTVAYIQSLGTQSVLKVQPTFKSFVLAGTQVNVDYLEKITGYDGAEIYTQQYKGSYSLDDVELDISSFAD